MGITKTLGGDRLGAGKRMKVHMHGYERSTHDMGYLWRSTMSAGTLVPFLCEVALPGDTFDINLDCDIKTHPTIGPLFGSYKVQLDLFHAPIRLYQGQLHNNKLGIGMNMANVKLPLMTLVAPVLNFQDVTDIDNCQINPSCLLSYLGIRGIGIVQQDEAGPVDRDFNAIPLLAYWDIYKNYYANKQEEIGYVIHGTPFTPPPAYTITSIKLNTITLPEVPTILNLQITSSTDEIEITFTGTRPELFEIVFNTSMGQLTADIVAENIDETTSATVTTFTWKFILTGPITLYNWQLLNNTSAPITPPTPVQFNLSQIDDMREQIMFASVNPTAFNVNSVNLDPYDLLLGGTYPPYLRTQEGLGLKTYQSDLFNNWLSTEWIDGTGGINDITAIDTSGGSFNIDTLNLSKKVYDMLNRIAVSGGSYDDWQDAVYDHERYTRCETPVYHGGLSKELVFQEVVSNATSESTETSQPLGTLAGKGILSKKHKGGKSTIKIDEPSYIMGIISLTPRVDYSQGNKWDTQLLTMDDLHKPALDEIGFQELITEKMAWWSTESALGSGTWTQKSAGKQPAWIDYMTNVNITRGNFAIESNEMFMTLNRRYEWNQSTTTSGIADLTTYIDPSKYNFIFAQTAIDAQNFWAQIAVDITARRKMSAKLMPNL